jgi:transcriptional regulator with XRE-family HTH domain
MDATKRKKLEARGWRVGSPAELLGLSAAESALVEFRLRLADALRELRGARGLSQVEVARRLGSSQSRVAKMEAADRSVTVDLMIRGLLASGATASDVIEALRGPDPARRSRVAAKRPRKRSRPRGVDVPAKKAKRRSKTKGAADAS